MHALTAQAVEGQLAFGQQLLGNGALVEAGAVHDRLARHALHGRVAHRDQQRQVALAQT